MKIGFCGLGQMGRHIAHNLAGSGSLAVVSNPSTTAFAEFEAKGVRATSDNRELAQADIIFLCLPNTAVVRDVIAGDRGLLDRLRAGQIIVDLSTIDYGATIETAKLLRERNIAFVDAPISGMEARAKDGTLTVMCGGSAETIEAIRPLLDLIGSKILHLGASGSGQLGKLINQLLFDINAAAIAEILPMAVKMGLEAGKVAEIVNSGTGRSYASEFFLPRILQGSFDAGYPLKAAYKDLVSAAEISMPLGIPLPVLAAATATYQQALLRGYGSQDKGAMIRVFEDLLGVQFRSEPNHSLPLE